MSRSTRWVLFAVVGSAGVCALFVAGAMMYLNARVDRTRLEAAASAALGMEVDIGGRVRVGYLPGLRITLENVRLRNQGIEIATAREARLQIGLLPLLGNEVRLESLDLKGARISIESDREGRFNFESPRAAPASLPALIWPNVSASDGTFVYTNRQSGWTFEARDCQADVPRLSLAGGRRRSEQVRALSFIATIRCGQVLSAGFAASDLRFSAAANDGVLDLNPVTLSVLGTQAAGRIHADFSASIPDYSVQFALPQFPIEEFFKTLTPRSVADGRMDFSASLAMQGTTVQQMRQTAGGRISLGGRNLTLNGTDLDRQFSQFESSQNFNVVDIGAFFFAGPLGLLVTKGYNFASIFQGTGGSSEIETLVSEWKVERGVAQAQDVAMATTQNRVAVRGGLDFVDDQFKDVTMALIDAKGCAKVKQKIRGTFQNPVVEPPNRLASLGGPVLKLLKQGADVLSGGKCDVFYAGSVAAPK